MTEAVRLESLYRTYDNQVTALDGVTAGFADGTFTAVMGPSGSGKSTLLHCAAGLDRPSAGRVFLGGTELTATTDTAMTKFRRARVGFVFQDYNLLPALTVEQNVQLPLRLAGRRADRRRGRAILEQLGLADQWDRRPDELSGGQRQRVAIARALLTEPAVIFADEPTGALDLRSAREVLALLRAVVREHGRTVVMVTHDPMAAAYADAVLFLADGRLAGSLAAPTAEAVAERLAHLGDAAAPADSGRRDSGPGRDLPGPPRMDSHGGDEARDPTAPGRLDSLTRGDEASDPAGPGWTSGRAGGDEVPSVAEAGRGPGEVNRGSRIGMGRVAS